MAINLSKGSVISLAKESGPAPLDRILIGLGWDPADTGVAFDLDASVFLTDSWGRCQSDADFVFYGSKVHYSGSVTHQGDNLTGDGDGDDEQILAVLTQVPPAIERLRIAVSIHDAAARAQHFGLVSNAFIRIVNQSDNRELARFTLSEGAGGQDSLTFAELFRDGADWRFRAIGEFNLGGLAGALAAHGLTAG
ncbi:TerD family protein [Nostocoides vanveenii]|jgi:tellurium resistance protein TerD|uniref:TerD family protein n=1 Tax=Nostocoides vanveenii TaxID=330835 RepID=A0ABN2KD58_9MICO